MDRDHVGEGEGRSAAPSGADGIARAADAPIDDDPYLRHPVRAGLMRLLTSQTGSVSVTATSAATELGVSSGLCSFHLRELAKHGYVEAVPDVPGRARPWRLCVPARDHEAPDTADFTSLARGLEDESYQRWLERRDAVPERWRRDDVHSGVLYLSPDELAEVAAALRAVAARYAAREHRPETRPAGAAPVAIVTRLFPLLPAAEPDAPAEPSG